MVLAVFDLDDTLLRGDSDKGWGRFLVSKGLLAPKMIEKAYEDYLAGKLDIVGYSEDMLKPVVGLTHQEIQPWIKDYLNQFVTKMVCPVALECWNWHKNQGHTMVIATATISLIADAVGALFAPDKVLSTRAQWRDLKLTGKLDGEPCFQEGKVICLTQWAQECGHDLQGSYFYSDSHNDIPLLKEVENPVAVNPDSILLKYAKSLHWPVKNWNNEAE